MAVTTATAREAAVAVTGAEWIGARLEDLDTPTPMIALDIMEGNITRMQAACDALGLRFRPHIKTHKIPAIAALQRAAGAHGLTAQKTTEAAVFAAAGFDDLLIAVPPVGRHKVARLCDLAETITVATVVDSVAAARMIAEGAAERGVSVGVFVELDSGYGRAGVQTGDEAPRPRADDHRTPRRAVRGVDVLSEPRRRGGAADSGAGSPRPRRDRGAGDLRGRVAGARAFRSPSARPNTAPEPICSTTPRTCARASPPSINAPSQWRLRW